ncbi:hypothetical protein RLEG3_05550 (plasmid) [Rhizobium leguminosarum bv. trifolii WSM1689]|nr:hypothetical protein RLEG3_05550 [Rhizobium leguminosarum bv. trifolii WSM1689]
MDIGDLKTFGLAAIPIVLVSAPLTYYQLARGRFRVEQTWLMIKVLTITLAMTAVGGCYWGASCTTNDSVRGLFAIIGLVGLLLSFLVVPVIGGGLVGQALAWAIWRTIPRLNS